MAGQRHALGGRWALHSLTNSGPAPGDLLGASHEHDHHQGRHAHLLQGLGLGSAGRIQPRLAVECGQLGGADGLPGVPRDQIVPIGAAGLASAKIVKNAKLIVYPGAPHGLTDTHKEKLNADLLAFIQS